MNRFRQLAAKMATILLTTVPLLTAAVPLSAQAAEDTEKTVRVGYVNALNYEEGAKMNIKAVPDMNISRKSLI